MNPARGHDQFRVQLWSGFYKTTWASYGQVRGCSHESFRQALAGRATLISIDELVLVAQNVRASADVASVVGFHAVGRVERRERGVGSLSRFRRRGRSSVCGGPGRQRGAACGDRPLPNPA